VRTELGRGSGFEVDDKGREVVGSSEDGKDEGATVGIPLEFTLSSEEGMDNGMQDGTVVGASLGLRVG